MKSKKISMNMKFLIAMIVLAVISLSAIGMTNIFAEPTIEELIEVGEIGTYKPETLANLNADEYELIDWIDMTELFFTYTYWKDVSGDGKIDPNEDVYQQDGFVENMLMGQRMYPIFSENKDSDYYFIPIVDYKKYNGVIASINIAGNNNLGSVKDNDQYWFDREQGILYIDRCLIDDIDVETYTCPIRAEVVYLVKDAAQINKTIDIYTLFDANISQTWGLEKSTPNGPFEQNINNWLLNELQYQLVPASQLAHASKNDLTVYVNSTEISEWYYDDTTGIITIKCDPYETDSVVVKFNNVQEANTVQSVLQFFQNSNDDKVGQATTLEDAINAAEISPSFIKMLTFDKKPTAGTTHTLSYCCYVREKHDANGLAGVTGVVEWGSSQYGSAPKQTVLSEVTKMWATAKENGWMSTSDYGSKYYRSGTLSAVNTNYEQIYGDVLYHVYLGSNGDRNALNHALSTAEKELFVSVGGRSTGHALMRHWLSFERGNYNGAYIVGDNTTSFLGGTVTEGNVMFDLTCASIEAADINHYNDIGCGYSEGYDYRSKVTILQVGDLDANGRGYLYVCIWSPSLAPHNYEKHVQRLLGFARIPYQCENGGTLQFQKKDANTGTLLSGAEYELYDSNGNKKQTIVSANSPLLVDLDAGEYYLVETKAPNGYVLNSTPTYFTINGGQTTTPSLTNVKQKANVTFTVFDETTRNATNVPLPGIQFKLYDGNDNQILTDANGKNISTLTTDANGRISFAVTADKEYYLRQIKTKANYYMIDDPSNNDYCGSILVNALPRDGNKNFNLSIVHWEHRQHVTIKTHVQDENLKENTPSNLGGYKGTGSYVCTTGAQYKLEATSPNMLLGYTQDGSVIYLRTEEPLWVSDSENGEFNQIVASESNSSNQAFLTASYVKQDDVVYKLPNGSYKWTMIKASEGYVNNGAYVEFSAAGSTDDKNSVLCVSNFVSQERQTVQITLFVKAYDEQHRTEDIVNIDPKFSTIIKENVFTRINSPDEIVPNGNPIIKWVDPSILKTVASTSSSISGNSQEHAFVDQEKNENHPDGYRITVETIGTVSGSVYLLKNIGPIVDIQSGMVIPDGTRLGIYMTYGDGYIKITNLGSKGFENKNPEINGGETVFEDVVPKRLDGKSTNGLLPNGTYSLTPIGVPQGYEMENGLSETIIFETNWTIQSSDLPSLGTNDATFLKKKPVKPVEPFVYVAPDIKPNAADPYDPSNPDKPDIDPDDSEDIPIVSTEWVDKNRHNVAYRIVDPDNLIGEGDDAVELVNDALPTTFAFYLKNGSRYDSNLLFDYAVSFYYEVDSAPSGALKSGEYIEIDGTYARRFKTNSLSGGESLENVIVFNSQSPGYVDYETLISNSTISAAVYNVEWINERLAEKQNGEYKIFIVVDTTVTYTDKGSWTQVVQKETERDYGVLVFKNRQLVNLD